MDRADPRRSCRPRVGRRAVRCVEAEPCRRRERRSFDVVTVRSSCTTRMPVARAAGGRPQTTVDSGGSTAAVMKTASGDDAPAALVVRAGAGRQPVEFVCLLNRRIAWGRRVGGRPSCQQRDRTGGPVEGRDNDETIPEVAGSCSRNGSARDGSDDGAGRPGARRGGRAGVLVHLVQPRQEAARRARLVCRILGEALREQCFFPA